MSPDLVLLLAEAEDRGYRRGFEAGKAAVLNRHPSRGQVPPHRSLIVRAPAVAAEWHPTRNGDLSPAMITAGTKQRAWWICERGHEWSAQVGSRVAGAGCGECAYDRHGSPAARPRGVSLAEGLPALVGQWHPAKNGDLTPETVTVSSGKKIWWLCEFGHEWDAAPNDRKRGTGKCPWCTGYRVSAETSLAGLHPQVAAEWHPTRNGVARPEQASPQSNRRVWWQCSTGHEWQTEINKRTSPTRPGNCPFCAGKRVDSQTCLAVTHPELAAEWHPTRNGDMNPRTIGAGSGRRAWWSCGTCGYEWWARIDSRARDGRGCSTCVSTTTSRPERELRERLAEWLPVVFPHPPIPTAHSLRYCDIVVPSMRLVVEFDGRYWHRDKLGVDKAKNTLLKRAGWQVIRVRESPLLLTGPDDVLIEPDDVDGAVSGVLAVLDRWAVAA